ncbi:von Hippel-Lindau-like protein [Saccostrea echinata]|uniref:von Hippel-Lindau-like protein n=1 Tax=Saccostrea echinata TaxID=191078 RepID=UPI002A7EFAFB|nr:von Hippel-Lindau-like protein [Saccostrea echinata]
MAANAEACSLRSEIKSSVHFENRCDRVAIWYWFNYNGDLVKYASLKKGEFIKMNTYVNHPWCARDRETNERLEINKVPVYYPTETQDGTVNPVFIDIPDTIPDYNDNLVQTFTVQESRVCVR